MQALIETERLYLRDVTIEDSADMFRLHSNAEVQKYTGEPMVASLAEMEQAIKRRSADYKAYGFGRWPTFLKDGNEFIGWAGLAYLPEFDEIDLGYRFLPQYWGKATLPKHRKLFSNMHFIRLSSSESLP